MNTPLRNPVSGEVKELTKEQFLALFDPSIHDKLIEVGTKEGTEALVCMEVLQMDSSAFGDRSALAVGPGRTYQLANVENNGFVVGQTPSQFKYPVAYWKTA